MHVSVYIIIYMCMCVVLYIYIYLYMSKITFFQNSCSDRGRSKCVVTIFQCLCQFSQWQKAFSYFMTSMYIKTRSCMGQEGGGRYLYTTANSLYNAVRHHLGHVFLNLNNGNAGLLCARGHECAQNYAPISQFYESCSQYP